tara:strand:- start:1815 stop:2621 length:807 start_codon:yes stop_codon:yes gene_type:complete
MSQIEVDKIIPQSGTSLQVGENGDTITLPAGATFNAASGTVTLPDGSVVNAKLANSAITINGSSVSLGGSVTIATESRPTFSSITPSTIENTQTTCVIAGGGFVTVPLVTAINSSTGARVVADEVAFNSASQITVKFTLPVDGTYLLYIENPDGNAVQTSAVLTVSDAPAWQTGAGSLGSFAAGSSFGTINLTATNSVSMAKVSGSFPGGMTLNSASGTSTLTGTESGATQQTTYSFTIRATDAEGQTADRAFTITVTVGINNSGQFN